MFSLSVELLFTVQTTQHILITVNISDKHSLPHQWYRVWFFQFVFHFETCWRNMTQGYLGGSKENPFIILGVCGVGEINRGVHAGFIYILLCEPNTLTWGKEDEWVVWGEEVRELQKQGGALEGKRKLEMERWRSYLYTKFFGSLTLWGSLLDWDADGIEWLHQYHLWNVLNYRGKQTPSYLPSLRDINGDKSVCDFSVNRIKEDHETDSLDKTTDISTVEVMLTRHLFNLCENPHPHTYVHTHNLTTTSPVSGSLIKLTGTGPSGQAKTSEPSPSCHDMMDLSTTGCQAATQVHLPVGVHQETLGKHPVDLICIYPTSPFTSKSDCMSKGRSRSPLLARSSRCFAVNLWTDVYLCCTSG